MKLPILLLITLAAQPLLSIAGEPLSTEQLIEIIGMSHEQRLDEPALKVYPRAREYTVSVTNTAADGQNFEAEGTATEKWVDGRYIVSEVQPAGVDAKFEMVVEYDQDSKRYRKYVIAGEILMGYQEGTRIPNTRTIAWIDLSSSKFDVDVDCLSTETHTETSTSWNSIYFQKGRFLRSELGIAKVTKPLN